MTYAMIHFISWPLIIYLSYKMVVWAVKKYEKQEANK